MIKQELIQTATAKNFQIEFSKDKFDQEMIGVCKGKGNWHWFTVLEETGYCLFHHTYSQNTGRTKKGIRHGLEVALSLKK